MSYLRRVAVFVCALSMLMAASCDDGDSKKSDTSAADTSAQDVDDGDTSPDLEEVVEDVVEDEVSVEVEDTFEVFVDPVIFALINLDTDLREIAYLRGVASITLPQMQLSAEDIRRDPIVGQTVVFTFPYPGSRAEPSQSVTDAAGLTEVFTFVLAGDMSGDTAELLLTPYFVGTNPNPLAEKAVDAYAIDIDVEYPTDANGDVLPLVSDGTTIYPVTFHVTRADGKPLQQSLSMEIEFIKNGGTSAVMVEGSSEFIHRWPIDVASPDISVNLVSSQVGATSGGLYFLRLFQKDAQHGQTTKEITLVAP